jgi:putative copper export protein
VTLPANWLTFLAVFALVGAAGARVLFTRLEASDAGTGAWTESDRLARRIGSGAAVILVIAAAFRLLAQAESFLDPGEYLRPDTVKAVLSTAWGRGWWIQVGSAALAILASLGPSAIAMVGALLVSMTLPLTGHAMEAPIGAILGVMLHGLHAFAGGLWLGTLAVGLFTWQRSDPPERSGRRHVRLARLIGKFSPMALAAAFVLVATGSAEALWLVGSFGALRDTVYGQRLVIKLALLAVLLAIGGYNWRVVRPSLGGRGASRRLLRTSLAELTVAALILGVTASLVALPAGE